MVEGTWATRRGSNPRLDPIIDIPATPPGEARPSSKTSFLSLVIPTTTISSSPTLTTAAIIASWYFSNIGVLLLNKYLLSIHGYRYPIFLTLLHMLACAIYSTVFVHWFRIVPPQPLSSRRQILKIALLSAIFCFSVVCGNTSLRYLPVSFNQAIGATTPFFTAVFALLITCRRESAGVYLSLLPVVLGIVVASNSEPLFHAFGFLVCLSSTAARALKSVVQGILLTSDAEKLNSMNLLMYMAPMAAAMLLPVTVWMEGDIAGLTVSKVLGNAKAAVAAVVSVLIFRNPVTVMGMTGFGITIMGVVLYSEAKKRSKISSSSSPSSSS